jgi:hypothetical protein
VDVLALMTVLVERTPDATDADVGAEIDRWTGRQRDKLAGAIGEQPVAGPVGRPMAPPAQVPAQAPARPVGR